MQPIALEASQFQFPALIQWMLLLVAHGLGDGGGAVAAHVYDDHPIDTVCMPKRE